MCTFVAVDLHGVSGTNRRRRLVMAEFVLGTASLIVLGLVLVAHGRLLWGLWLLGCGGSYGALAIQAAALYSPARCEAVLSGLDARVEIRRYSLAQLLLFVPGLIAGIALVETVIRRRVASRNKKRAH